MSYFATTRDFQEMTMAGLQSERRAVVARLVGGPTDRDRTAAALHLALLDEWIEHRKQKRFPRERKLGPRPPPSPDPRCRGNYNWRSRGEP